MKRKEVEDVMGGKEAWANVDRTDGMFDVHGTSLRGVFLCGAEGLLRVNRHKYGQCSQYVTDVWVNVVQCPNENCDNASAFFYQVQIRSADEPMTTFYKVRPFS